MADTPEEFIRQQLAASYPRWDVLCRIPPEVTAPFFLRLRKKWEDRNLLSLGEVLRVSDLFDPTHAEPPALRAEQHQEIRVWLDRLGDVFIKLAEKALEARLNPNGEPDRTRQSEPEGI